MKGIRAPKPSHPLTTSVGTKKKHGEESKLNIRELPAETVVKSVSSPGFRDPGACRDDMHLQARTKAFVCKPIATVQHSGTVNNASFPPDENYFATASDDDTAQIWGLVGGQWQEKATVQHASCPPDENYFATASDDKTAKIHVLKSKEKNDAS